MRPALGLVLGASGVLPAITPSADIILLLFLPPLIFEAGFVLDLPTLWSVRVGVATLALPGVLRGCRTRRKKAER